MRTLRAGVVGLFIFGAARALGAIMLDVGTAATITAPANSPAHAVGAVPTAETTWNKFISNIAAGGVQNSDGTVATGVSVTIGMGSATGTTSFTAPTISSLGGTSGNTLGTDYSGTAAQDGIFKTGATGGSTTASVGLRIDGLAAGTYTIYGVLRNTNVANTTTSEALYAGAGASATSFTFSALTPAAVGNLSGSNNNTWTSGDQFGTLTVALSDGQSLYIIADGTGSTEKRGMMNAIQIVVPEPGTVALIILGLGVSFSRRPGRR